MFGSLVGKVARMGPADAFRVGLTMAALRLATVLAVTTAAVAVAAAPALADVAGADPPDYVLEEDGTVLIDGDLATDCPSFALGLEEGYDLGPNNPERARAVLEQCEEAGLLDSGDGTPSASASASASEPAGGEDAALPETGGVPPPLFVVALLMASAAGLLASRKVW